MQKCDCCDHILEHAISSAVNAASWIGSKQALKQLSEFLEDWKDEQ